MPIKTIPVSGNRKTGAIAITYRAAPNNSLGTCPVECALNPNPTQYTDKVDERYLDALLRSVPRAGQSFTYTHFHYRHLPPQRLERRSSTSRVIVLGTPWNPIVRATLQSWRCRPGLLRSIESSTTSRSSGVRPSTGRRQPVRIAETADLSVQGQIVALLCLSPLTERKRNSWVTRSRVAAMLLLDLIGSIGRRLRSRKTLMMGPTCSSSSNLFRQGPSSDTTLRET